MKNYVLKTHNINKQFHKFTALKDVTISIEKGKIYGLIGTNGAGKSSLMRIITGLSIPTSGSYELFGYRNRKDIQHALQKVGSLIEHPSLNVNMTARENLQLYKIMKGIHDKEIDYKLLDIVGLGETGKKKTKDFSLGMRQRLGIAISLLGNPELLILDEPINGLDPLGVIEMRDLIKHLCEEKGITILISSHNLTELYQTATDYIIIDKGEIKKTISLQALEEECQYYFNIQTKHINKLKNVLEGQMGTTNYKVMTDNTVRLFDFTDETERLAETLVSNGIIMTRFAVEGGSLESYFTNLVGGFENG